MATIDAFPSPCAARVSLPAAPAGAADFSLSCARVVLGFEVGASLPCRRSTVMISLPPLTLGVGAWGARRPRWSRCRRRCGRRTGGRAWRRCTRGWPCSHGTVPPPWQRTRAARRAWPRRTPPPPGIPPPASRRSWRPAIGFPGRSCRSGCRRAPVPDAGAESEGTARSSATRACCGARHSCVLPACCCVGACVCIPACSCARTLSAGVLAPRRCRQVLDGPGLLVLLTGGGGGGGGGRVCGCCFTAVLCCVESIIVPRCALTESFCGYRAITRAGRRRGSVSHTRCPVHAVSRPRGVPSTRCPVHAVSRPRGVPSTRCPVHAVSRARGVPSTQSAAVCLRGVTSAAAHTDECT
jgi:hypothetical protein